MSNRIIHKSQYSDGANYHLARCDAELHLEITYPPRSDAEADREGRIKYVVVGIEDVRAADSVRISYDFDRDGYKIEQAANFAWEADDKVCDPGWQEVAFIQAWAREKLLG